MNGTIPKDLLNKKISNTINAYMLHDVESMCWYAGVVDSHVFFIVIRKANRPTSDPIREKIAYNNRYHIWYVQSLNMLRALKAS